MSEPPRKPEQLLNRLDWTVLRRLDGLLQGDYRTLFRGGGLDLADLREYQLTDDARHIDWNVTARTNTPHVREYNEDREITAWFLLDLSPSVDFGSNAVKKRQLLIEFTAVLARLLTRSGNRVGALFYGAGVDTVIPARGGRRHVLHLLDTLMARPEMARAPATDLADFLRAGFEVIRRRALVFVVSDFISAPGWDEALGMLARRHELLAVRLFDPAEMALPDLGLVPIEDAETGEQMWVDTSDKGFRKRFAAVAKAREAELREALARAGVDALELSTEGDIAGAILRFSRLRRQRDRLASGSGARVHFAARGAGMTFLWPSLLWNLLAVPLLVGLYIHLLRRRKALAVRYASLSMVKQAGGGKASWRRHLPPALFLLGITVLLLAVARPAAVITLASQRAQVLLAMDVSGSMRAADVDPSRIVAAQNAAKEFVKGQPRDVRIGIVSFAGAAFLVQAPTTNKDDLSAAIDRFELQRGTAMGSGIVVALQTIFPQETFAPPGFGGAGFGGGGGFGDPYGGAPLGEPQPQAAKKPAPKPVPPGSYPSALIIVMTDGQTTTGPDPVEAARLAANHGVRVFTIGFGSTDGDVVGFGGRYMRAQLDEESLKQVADMTKGQYFRAASAEALKKIYQGLNTQLIKERKETEVTAFFAAVAAALMILAAALSMLWFGRVL